MPSLEDSRLAFLSAMRRYTLPPDRPHFEAVLDDFIQWSTARSNELTHVDKQYQQGVVSFRGCKRDVVVWSAYPRGDGGAKLEILPGAAHILPGATHQDALDTLSALSREPISENTTMRVPFSALKNHQRRERVKALLERLLLELS